MSDLLKQAIADAKSVRETALLNAKLQLEEAFRPQLQDMISRKIESELSDDEEVDFDVEEPIDGDGGEADVNIDVAPEAPIDADPVDSAPVDAAPAVDPTIPAVDATTPSEDPAAPVADPTAEPIVDPTLEPAPEETDEAIDSSNPLDLELEDLIRELEADQEDEIDFDQLNSQSQPQIEDEACETTPSDETFLPKNGDEDLEEIDLNELLQTLTEEETADAEEKEEDDKEIEISELKSELTATQSQLQEHIKVVKILRDKLNEINLLNAKLLYTNKLFKKYSLNNEQKMRVVENIDRAKTIREIKLLYTTIFESLNTATMTASVKSIKESASKSTATSKKKQEVIMENAKKEVEKIQQVDSYSIVDAESAKRLMLLANIKNK